MQIYKRSGSKFWYYRFELDGKEYRGSTKRPHSDQAGARRVLAAEYEKHMNHRQFGEKPEVTLAQAFDVIIGQVQSSPNTARSYRLIKEKTLGMGSYAGRSDIFSLPHAMRLSELKDHHLDDIQRERRSEGLKPNTINGEMRVIRRMWNANKKRYAADPDLTFPMLKGFEKTRFLTISEEEAILARLRAHQGKENYERAADLYIYLVDTGVRLSEALAVTWGDIDMTNGSIEVYRQKTNSLSIVPISDRVQEMLNRRSNHPQPFQNMDNPTKKLREAISEVCNVNQRIIAQRGAATIHSLRDTFASRLVQRGMTLYEVSKLLGHASMTMTRKYAHIETADVSSKARMMLNG